MDLDSDLMRRIAAADTDAFTAFYDRHAPTVLGLLVKLLPQRNDAEDVLQETFCQVWRLAERFDASRASARAWLLMLARSRALDHLRRLKPVADATGTPEPFTRATPAASAEQQEAAAQVRAALAQLPEEHSSALTLAFYGGLTHEQVAERQQLPLGTVKTRIRLGMKRLRGLLGG